MLETGTGLMPYGHMIVSPRGSVLNRCLSVPASDIGIYGAAQNMIRYQTHAMVKNQIICRFIGQYRTIQIRTPHFRHLFVLTDASACRYRFKALMYGRASRQARKRIRAGVTRHITEYFNTRDLAKTMSKADSFESFKSHLKKLCFKEMKNLIIECLKLLKT